MAREANQNQTAKIEHYLGISFHLLRHLLACLHVFLFRLIFASLIMVKILMMKQIFLFPFPHLARRSFYSAQLTTFIQFQNTLDRSL